MNTPKIGSAKVAKEIASFKPQFLSVEYCTVDYENPTHWKHKNKTCREILDNSHELPPGWSYLGHGASRIAFLGPDGFVYKRGYTGIWRGRNRGDGHCEAEGNSYPHVSVKAAKSGIYIPQCRWYRSVRVLAVELIEKGRDYKEGDDVDSKAHSVGLWDVHQGNFWFDKHDRLVCVDFA